MLTFLVSSAIASALLVSLTECSCVQSIIYELVTIVTCIDNDIFVAKEQPPQCKVFRGIVTIVTNDACGP